MDTERASTHDHATAIGNGQLLFTIPEAAEALALGRTKIYELIGAGELEVVHVGRAVRVPAAALAGFVERRRTAGR